MNKPASKPITLRYDYRYTTSGGAHRYSPRGKPKVTVGDVYLRGVSEKNPPRYLKLTVELGAR